MRIVRRCPSKLVSAQPKPKSWVAIRLPDFARPPANGLAGGDHKNLARAEIGPNHRPTKARANGLSTWFSQEKHPLVVSTGRRCQLDPMEAQGFPTSAKP